MAAASLSCPAQASPQMSTALKVPIVFNDHHVHARPRSILVNKRVLAALVWNGTLLVPLRSMFEATGASVSFDRSTKTVTLTKPDTIVSVQVGSDLITINGSARPLDVAPMIYHGVAMVPVRALAEAVGAYVQWQPDSHTVVIRYVASPPPMAAPAATAAPATAPPSAAPTPAPSATPTAAKAEVFVAGDYVISPKVYNEFDPGTNGNVSYQLHGAAEFNASKVPLMIELNIRHYSYPHVCDAAGDAECFVTTIGGAGSTSVPQFTAQNQNFDGRIGLELMHPRIYVVGSYLSASDNYGYPNLHGLGFGLDKLPDLDQTLSIYGSVLYYPQVQGNFGNAGNAFNLSYHVLKYDIGVDYIIANSPVYLEGGWLGEDWFNRTNAPIGQAFNGPYVGLGVKF